MKDRAATNHFSLLSDLSTRFSPLSDSPSLDASVLLAHIIHKPRTWVLAHPELTLTGAQQNQLNDSLARIQAGEPLPYVIGHWEFFGLEFEVTQNVLIPRPETELLVEKAIGWLQRNHDKRNIADIGTGSGAIAISIAIHLPDAKIFATDVSAGALRVAKRNAEKHHVEDRIEFIECDLLPQSSFAAYRSAFNLICANLPYIPSRTLSNLPIYQREPTLALDGGEDGLFLIRKLVAMAPEWLSADGLMLMEIEASQRRAVSSLAHEIFPNASIDVSKDLAGRDRLLSIERTGKADRNKQ